MPYKSRFSGEWRVGMCSTPCIAPFEWLKNCCCPCCVAYVQRTLLIDQITGGKYYCCAGMYPCCCLKDECPRELLCCEVICCTSCAVIGNRFLIQESKQLRNTPCDNCILWTTCLCSCAICILQLLGVNVPEEIQCLADLLYWTVMGCMQTQQAIEMGWCPYTDDRAGGPPKQNM